MRHRNKKIRIGGGRDADRMLLRKLTVNFLTKGKITTTKAKAKALISHLEKIITRAKEQTEANKYYLLKKLGDYKIVKILFRDISPMIKTKTSGHLKQKRLGMRLSDGSEMVQVNWSVPVVLTKEKTSTKG